MQYRSSHVATIYDISTHTVGTWAREFEEYLSPTANPGTKKQRMFTTEDMRVFSLVSELQKQGMAFAEIHANLKSGNRGDAPVIEPNEVQAIVSGEVETRLAIENQRLKQAMVDAQDALKKAQTELAKMREVEDDNIRLRAQLEAEQAAKADIETRLEKQVEQLQKEIKDLALQTGREYAKGFVEGIRNREEIME
jgi:DNA-binding transcriptional MerR regulator